MKKTFFAPATVILLIACCVTHFSATAQLYGGLSGNFAHRSEDLLQGKAINPTKMSNTLNLQFHGGYNLELSAGDSYTNIVSDLSITLYPDNVNGLNVQCQFGTLIPIGNYKLFLLAGPSYNMAWTYGKPFTLAKTIRLSIPNKDGASPTITLSHNNTIYCIGVGLQLFQE